MKENIKTRKIKVYSEKCLICSKNITGYSESQVKYNMKLHKEKHDKE